ncbi:MAG: aminotransferase class V-fold PLP-dependent enzyme, partial [Verrucomicrobiota bacterium]
MTKAFDVDAIRADFPLLSREVGGKPLTYLDNGATAQKPQVVIDRLTDFLSSENSNIHRGIHRLSAAATEAYEDARKTIGRYLGMPDTHELIFVRGATEGINLVANGIEERVSEGDEVIIP